MARSMPHSRSDATQRRVPAQPALGTMGEPGDKLRSMAAPQDTTGLTGSNGVEQQVKEPSTASFQATLASWREKEIAEKSMCLQPIGGAVYEQNDDDTCLQPIGGAVNEQNDDDACLQPIGGAASEQNDDGACLQPIGGAASEQNDDDACLQPIGGAASEQNDDDACLQPIGGNK
jgi:hypothetical protein